MDKRNTVERKISHQDINIQISTVFTKQNETLYQRIKQIIKKKTPGQTDQKFLFKK